MGIVDWTEIATDLTMVNERVSLLDVHIYLSPPTRYTCLICPTMFVVDTIHIHGIHASAKYETANRALCRLYQATNTPRLARRLSNALDRVTR
jgi:hypothetical protein